MGDPTDPLRAITIGAGSPALASQRAASTVVFDPAGFRLSAPPGSNPDRLSAAFRAAAAPVSPEATMAAAQQAIPATLDAVAALAPALQAATAADPSGTTTPTTTPPTSTRAKGGNGGAKPLTDLLDVAARVIDLQLGTQVIVVTASGYDTHANQAQMHPVLLADLASGLDGFLGQVEAQGHGDQVALITTSEFGRRAAENGSGTDHGQASVQFVAGGPVASAQIVGQAQLDKLDQGDLPIVIDTRSVYAAALDWLGGPTDEILGAAYDRYGLLRR